jgi:hypothetical protein
MQGLPETDQERVPGFLQALKRRHEAMPAPALRPGRKAAPELKNSRLVFTGKLGARDVD